MNKRIVEMILMLSESKGSVSLEQLAERFEVSQRTVRNDINEISSLLKKKGLRELHMRKGVITVQEDFGGILPELDPTDYYSYKLSKEERKMVAASLLIGSAGYITLGTIADALFVSRATIIADLDDIKNFVKDGNLRVTSHSNKGLRVEGPESEKRWFLYRLSAFKIQSASSGQSTPVVNVQAGDAITIRKIVSEQEKVHRRYLSDQSYLMIVKYLGIMIDRNLKGEYIEERPAEESEYFSLAQDIIRYIVQYCGIRTIENEIRYLAEILSRCRYVNREHFDVRDIRIQVITRQFIQGVSESLGIRLTGDYVFFENLSNHLESMFEAYAAHFPENPEVSEIIKEHPEIRESVLENIEILRKYDDRELTETELLYIMIHVCAAVERKKNREVSFHVIVACHAGIGTSQLLLEKLKQHFRFQIVDIVSAHEASRLKEGQADLIISTVRIPECKIENVVVSAFLNDEDYLRVGNKIDAIRSSRHLSGIEDERELTASRVLEQIRPVVTSRLDEETAGEIIRDIRGILRNLFREQVGQEEVISVPLLHHLLPATHIQLDVECADWREAVRASARPLYEMGYIEERYISEVIRNVEENGPYIVISPGFAFPHAGLEGGSVRVGMNLIRLGTPVSFESGAYDPVEFVCALSAVDHKTHLKAFFNLVNLLRSEDFKEAFRKAETTREAAQVIEKYENGIGA